MPDPRPFAYRASKATRIIGLARLGTPAIDQAARPRATDGATRVARLVGVVLPTQILRRVLVERNAEGLGRLCAPVDDALLIDVEISAPGPTAEGRLAPLNHLLAILDRIAVIHAN